MKYILGLTEANFTTGNGLLHKLTFEIGNINNDDYIGPFQQGIDCLRSEYSIHDYHN